MLKLYKLIILLVLVGATIILSSTLFALQFVSEKRKTKLKQLRKEQRSKVNAEAKRSASQAYNMVPPSSSSSSSPKSHGKNTPKGNKIKETVQTLHPQNIKIRQLHGTIAPDSSSTTTIAESHLGLALRDIPFEAHSTQFYDKDGTMSGSASTIMNSGSSGNNNGHVHSTSSNGGSSTSTSGEQSYFSPKFGGNAIPPILKYGAIVSNEELEHVDKKLQRNGDIPDVIGGMKRTGVEFVKLENPNEAMDGNARQYTSSLGSSSSSSITTKVNRIKNSILSSLLSSSSSSGTNSRRSNVSRRKKTSASQNNDNTFVYSKEQSALYHLQKASEYGNHYAQNMIANSLASGILPINNSPSIRQYLNVHLNVTSDFAVSSSSDEDHNYDKQLTNAILLWHMSAMEGNIESILALGYRHFISATSRSSYLEKVMVDDEALKEVEALKYGNQLESNTNDDGDNPFKNVNHLQQKKSSPVRHSSQESDHYGVLGTCESSLAYYEEAVHHMMDELESGPLRAKVAPAQDTHILPEIRQRGSSSALTSNNKPDELDEAIKFMAMRASKKNDPDIHSAYKLGTMYHYGLRGVKQDMRLALKYYEIGAINYSWECAGQAGKFYLFGMGLSDEERDLNKALKYFEIGMAGGIHGCEEKFFSKKESKNKGKRNEDDDEEDDEDNEDNDDETEDDWEDKVHQCDHPSVNGMGLLHLFGVPGKIKPNLKTARRHLELATKMGNMDAMYNVAMMRLGWMNPYYDDLFLNIHTKLGEDEFEGMKKKSGPSAAGFVEATSLLTRSAEMGHLQAKHRLGMIYSKGYKFAGNLGKINIRPECKKALSIFKGMSTTVGITITKRMRAAYKQYKAGDYESSLRNYLAAAETGSIEAQVNAAFLLEEGYCLGMNHLQCMKASVRLWRAAARMGHEEACLRVGDFYFYGRLREDIDFDDKNSIVAQRDIEFSLSLLPWTRYILFPEDMIPKARKSAIHFIRWLLGDRQSSKTETCSVGDVDGEGTCLNPDTISKSNERFTKVQKEHFKIAAKYYRTAASDLLSARANFNLGFMHEWGLGLSQDFPLAKRYYDLAAQEALNKGDGALANQIALVSMNIHEFVVKLKSSYNIWLAEKQANEDIRSSTDPSILDDSLQSTTRTASGPTTRTGVIIYHILTWESAIILVLLLILTGLIQHRVARRRPQR